MKIPVSTPVLDQNDAKAVAKTIEQSLISGLCGDQVAQFESQFAAYSDCKYGIAVNSGTTALHLAMVALGIGPGDEVLVSTQTNMATFFAVLYTGAKPIPIDILPDTLNLNPDLLEPHLTNRTKAVLVVHLFGLSCDMKPIVNFCAKHKLFLVEDCAEAHGATYQSRKVGSFGDFGCFSFYANKIITTGEGGMLTTNNEALAEKVRGLKSLAFGSTNKFMHVDIGFGFRMSNIQAALGVTQLAKIDTIIARKRRVAEIYTDKLRLLPLQLPLETPETFNVYWMYHIIIDDIKKYPRDHVMRELQAAGIETRETFIPYNLQEIFLARGLTHAEACPVANQIAYAGFYLPSGPNLTIDEQQYIVDNLKRILA